MMNKTNQSEFKVGDEVWYWDPILYQITKVKILDMDFAETRGGDESGMLLIFGHRSAAWIWDCYDSYELCDLHCTRIKKAEIEVKIKYVKQMLRELEIKQKNMT